MTTRNPTLLIVDDDESQRWFLQRAFERTFPGYAIHVLSSGNEAVAYLAGDAQFTDRAVFPFPSGVITDLKMADGDGFVILEFLRSNPSLSVVPVIVLSCSDDPDDVRQAYLLGAKSFFAKPSGQPALEALARKVHDYWTACEIPAVDQQGYATATNSRGKLGDRLPKAAATEWNAPGSPDWPLFDCGTSQFPRRAQQEGQSNRRSV